MKKFAFLAIVAMASTAFVACTNTSNDGETENADSIEVSAVEVVMEEAVESATEAVTEAAQETANTVTEAAQEVKQETVEAAQEVKEETKESYNSIEERMAARKKAAFKEAQKSGN